MPRLLPSTASRREVRAAIERLVGDKQGSLRVVVATAFLGGIAEAGVLVIISKTALAVTKRKEVFALAPGVHTTVLQAVLVAVGILAARYALTVYGLWVQSRLAVRVVTEQRHRLAEAYVRAGWPTLQRMPAGRLQELMSGVAASSSTLVAGYAAWRSYGLNLMALLLVSLAMNPIATVVVLIALSALSSVLAPLRKRIRRVSHRAAVAQLGFAGECAELGSMGLEMQAFGVGQQFTAVFDGSIERVSRPALRAQRLGGLMSPTYVMLAYGALVTALGLATFASAGALDDIAAVLLVMMRCLSYGQSLQVSSALVNGSLPAIDVLDGAVTDLESQAVPSTGRSIDGFQSIRFDDVSFGYEPDRPVLHDVSFDMRAGEIVGIIGPSGSGKSTLVQLLLGLRDPDQGSVLIDGTNLSDISRASWTALSSFVPQDPVLLGTTVAECVRFLRSGISDDDVRAALSAANLGEEIESRPGGIHTPVAQRGSSLSGGQRQRVSIARALAGHPRLLIMDEPTASLDVHSEALIRDALAELRGRVTVVIIAHRLSTLEICDRIMVIQHGVVKGFDTPQRLAANNQFYRESLELSGIAKET